MAAPTHSKGLEGRMQEGGSASPSSCSAAAHWKQALLVFTVPSPCFYKTKSQDVPAEHC